MLLDALHILAQVGVSVVAPALCHNRYEATCSRDPVKDEVKVKFAAALQFVEEYLSNVVNRSWSFADKEQNKLTYEVHQVD